MKCPYCGTNLTVHDISNPEWINENDTVVKFECCSYCYKCDLKFAFDTIYTKTEEKNLNEW